MINQFAEIYGNSNEVFYIYAPRWSSASAGIRALHLLCHSLNKLGFDAYLILSDSEKKNVNSVSGNLMTPILSQSVHSAHILAGRKPIAIYSETVPGNPLKATRVVRYLMNYPGALGGTLQFDPEEYLLAYSENIALKFNEKSVNQTVQDVLFLPAVDPKEFNFNLNNREEYYLLYAGKYRAFIGEPPSFPGRPVIEILRHGSRAQSREELIYLLSKCRAVISMENSSIITEAILSGAPGLFYPNEFLDEAIAEVELGWGGTGWGIDEETEKNARETLRDGLAQYEFQVINFQKNLTESIMKIIDNFRSNTDTNSLAIPRSYKFISMHKIRLSIQIITKLGFRSWLRVSKNYISRRVSHRF